MPRTTDTLFTRLLVAQAITAVALVALFVTMFYVERNVTLARLVADRWAAALRAQAGVAAPRPTLAPTVERRADLPDAALPSGEWLPRMRMLRDALREQGVPVEAVAITRRGASPVVWVSVSTGDGGHEWLGIADPLVEPGLPQRVVLAGALGLLAVAGVSYGLARRLTAPLARLRDRIATHDPAAPTPGDTAPGRPGGGTAEVAEIETAWHRLTERLARQQRERQLLLAGVSHDLRGPLARIRLGAELLPESPDTAARRDAIVRNVDLADRLVGSFLDLVRAETLPADETVDLAALARDLARGSALGDLDVQTPPTLPLPGANRLLLERAMLNLLDNAARHGRAPVRLRVRADGRGAVIEVQDAGPGIAPADRARLVEAFARGDDSRSAPGTGLGLAVVAQVAARLGGRLELDGGPGRHVSRLVLPR